MGRKPVWQSLSILLVLGFTACGTAAGEPSPQPTATEEPGVLGTITRTGSECNLDLAADPVRAGKVEITVVNDTDALTTVDMWRITEGHSFQEFAGHIAQERQLAENGELGQGAPAYVDDLQQFVILGGEADTRVKTLAPGTYGVVCYREFPEVGLRPYTLIGPIEVVE